MDEPVFVRPEDETMDQEFDEELAHQARSHPPSHGPHVTPYAPPPEKPPKRSWDLTVFVAICVVVTMVVVGLGMSSGGGDADGAAVGTAGASFDADVAEGVTLVVFSATWCGPCKMQAPIVEKVAAAMEGRARVIKIDVDERSEIAHRFGVRAVPTLMVFADGKEVRRASGVQSEQVLTGWLAAALGD